MNAGARTLVDRVLPDVPLRQFVVTVPFPLRFPLAFDGKLLSQVVRIFIDTVAANYRKRLAKQGIPGGKHGAIAVIQRANSDLRFNPHVHAIFPDRLYTPDSDGQGFMFHPAPAPTREDVEGIVEPLRDLGLHALPPPARGFAAPVAREQTHSSLSPTAGRDQPGHRTRRW